MVGPNLPFGGLACGLVLGPLPSMVLLLYACVTSNVVDAFHSRCFLDSLCQSILPPPKD